MPQTYQININRDYNTNSKNNFSLGRTNPVSDIKSNHILILYQNHLFYEEQNNIKNISIKNVNPKSSSVEHLFGIQNNQTILSLAPSFIKYKVS